jgi:HEPN domain-containing protein
VNEETRKWFSSHVRDLRDTADEDYIAARITSRLGLYRNSAWCGLQALEKYLKVILLYSDQSVKRFRSHSLSKLLAAVERLPRISFELPDDCREFVTYLDEQGPNRYGDIPEYGEGLELFKLDRLVWHVRRYSQDFLLLPGDDSRYPGESAKRLAGVPGERSWATLSVFGLWQGFLEGVLEKPDHSLRPYLVWKNKYYSIKKRSAIRFTRVIRFKRSALIMRPEILLPVLEHRLFIPPEVLEALRERKAERENQKPEISEGDI